MINDPETGEITDEPNPLVKEIPLEDQPVAEQYRITALRYNKADTAANLMEELKTTTLEKMKAALIRENPGIAVNKAEMLAKCSDNWSTYIREMVAIRGEANQLKSDLEVIKMRAKAEENAAWLGRMERGLGRHSP